MYLNNLPVIILIALVTIIVSVSYIHSLSNRKELAKTRHDLMAGEILSRIETQRARTPRTESIIRAVHDLITDPSKGKRLVWARVSASSFRCIIVNVECAVEADKAAIGYARGLVHAFRARGVEAALLFDAEPPSPDEVLERRNETAAQPA